jgi:hypothetical protein
VVHPKDELLALCDSYHAQARRIAELESERETWEGCAKELLDSLRDHWRAESYDAITLFMVAFVGGIKTEFLNLLPENGFVTSAVWPEIGALEIDIHRVTGKPAAETMRAQDAEIERLKADASTVARGYEQTIKDRNDEIGRLKAKVAAVVAFVRQIFGPKYDRELDAAMQPEQAKEQG